MQVLDEAIGVVPSWRRRVRGRRRPSVRAIATPDGVAGAGGRLLVGSVRKVPHRLERVAAREITFEQNRVTTPGRTRSGFGVADNRRFEVGLHKRSGPSGAASSGRPCAASWVRRPPWPAPRSLSISAGGRHDPPCQWSKPAARTARDMGWWGIAGPLSSRVFHPVVLRQDGNSRFRLGVIDAHAEGFVRTQMTFRQPAGASVSTRRRFTSAACPRGGTPSACRPPGRVRQSRRGTGSRRSRWR